MAYYLLTSGSLIDRYRMAMSGKHDPQTRYAMKLGWFTSAWDEQALTLFRATCASIDARNLRASIDFVLCTMEQRTSEIASRMNDLASARGIPVFHISPVNYRKNIGDAGRLGEEDWRARYEADVLEALEEFQPDLVVLSGYMLVAGASLLDRFRMINLHPALPGGPTGTRGDVIEALIAERACEAGVMMHVVTPVLDGGPAITYTHFPISGPAWRDAWEGDRRLLFAAIEAEILAREPNLVVETLKVIAESDPNQWPPLQFVDWQG